MPRGIESPFNVGRGPLRSASSGQLSALPIISNPFAPNIVGSSGSWATDEGDSGIPSAPLISNPYASAEGVPAPAPPPAPVQAEGSSAWGRSSPSIQSLNDMIEAFRNFALVPSPDIQAQREFFSQTGNPNIGDFRMLYSDGCFENFHPEEFIAAGTFSQVWSLDENECPIDDCKQYVLRTSLIHDGPQSFCGQGTKVVIDNRVLWRAELDRLIEAQNITIEYDGSELPIAPLLIRAGICTGSEVQFCHWPQPQQVDIGFVVVERVTSDLQSYFNALIANNLLISPNTMIEISYLIKTMLKKYFAVTGNIIRDMHLANVLVDYDRATFQLKRLMLGDFGMVESVKGNRVTAIDDIGGLIRLSHPWEVARNLPLNQFSIIMPRLEVPLQSAMLRVVRPQKV